MAKTTYYAHSVAGQDRSTWQTLEDHSMATAELAAQCGAPLGLQACARLVGLLHDFGKYDPDFDRVLCGEPVRVNHSTAGAKLLLDRAPTNLVFCAEALAYTILGHHAGLPDRRQAGGAGLDQRLETHRDRIDPAITAAMAVDFAPVSRELAAHVDKDTPGFDLSVAVRMVFSCLVDADYRDTAAFYERVEGRRSDRQWPALGALLPSLTAAFDQHMARFSGTTALNQTRQEILTHVRSKAAMSPGLFTLSVPTGGGKTLASLGFALDHAQLHGHRRIIYAIPYTSIIDQTAQVFRDVLGEDVVLEHHAAIDEEQAGAAQRDKLRLAMENWSAPVIVTTNVQLFESLFSARPSRARKLHNIAGSIIVLDEAQCLPRPLLMPMLRMVDTLAKHYGCTIVLCTATQPAFDSTELKAGGLALVGRELAPDPHGLSRRLRRACIVQGGDMDDTALVEALREQPQALVIVNSRAHALDLFRAAQADGLAGVLHLTTRQYPAHRRRIIDDVRARLKGGQQCRLIATSLIEAGVDVDFPVGWRAAAGLDACVQAAGRVNREGARPLETSILTVFSAPGQAMPSEVRALADAMRSTALRHDDLLSLAAIRDWFEQVYWKAGVDRLGQALVSDMVLAPQGTDFPFRRVAEAFRMIETTMEPVIVVTEPDAAATVARLAVADIPSGLIARELQPYVVQVPPAARASLVRNGHASFHAPECRGDQFCVLDTASLYHEDSGLWWEAADYLAKESWLI